MNFLALCFVGFGRILSVAGINWAALNLAIPPALRLWKSESHLIFQIFGGRAMANIFVCEKNCNYFSYVFPARTLYQLRLEAESNGRAVRA